MQNWTETLKTGWVEGVNAVWERERLVENLRHLVLGLEEQGELTGDVGECGAWKENPGEHLLEG